MILAPQGAVSYGSYGIGPDKAEPERRGFTQTSLEGVVDDIIQLEGHASERLDERVAPPPGASTFSESEFIALVERYSDDLRGFFRRRGVEPSDCKDRVQECFEVLWRKRSDVDPARAEHYLFGIARNVMSAHWRKRMREIALSDVHTYSEGVTAMEADRSMEVAEGLQRLNELLESLPQRQREVLELLYGRDLSIAEAARRLGVSDATARTHQMRALKSLAERFQRYSEQP